jgi:isopropylmalate/homocitrate/citramalate synthase
MKKDRLIIFDTTLRDGEQVRAEKRKQRVERA